MLQKACKLKEAALESSQSQRKQLVLRVPQWLTSDSPPLPFTLLKQETL